MGWSVSRYAPGDAYGFALHPEEGELYFLVEDFVRRAPFEPLPIVGEGVLISGVRPSSGRRKQATEVVRMVQPALHYGEVLMQSHDHKWGYIRRQDSLADGEDVFFHVSDIVGSWLPHQGQLVSFYVGQAKSRPRAAWIREGRDGQ